MPPDRRREIDRLLDEALDLPQERRAAFLEERCGEDAELLERVTRLLEVADVGGGILDRPPADVVPDLIAELADAAGGEPAPEQDASITDEHGGGILDASSPVPDRLGPYRIKRLLGRGGMGVVYLGERFDGQFELSVAIKIIRRGLDTDEIVRRFRQERQILARLRHPNIARLLDGGVAPDGRSFLVMEYVSGVPLTQYCRERRLGLEARLDLFATVCDAVRYAHQSLVIHRDLKPSNILVDEDGQVTLLDFGIAKLLDPDDADDSTDTPVTRAGDRLLTPEYASPEQARGEASTTATDVYALGVLLYELLTGQRPHTFDSTTPEDVRATLTRTPPLPSSVVHAAARAPVAPSPGEASEPGTSDPPPTPRLASRLRGDLDAIAMTALHPELDRRYPSAEALLSDVRRHRSGLPISASADSIAYRARKFVARHTAAVATAVLLASFGVYHAVRVSVERDRALLAAEQAQEVTDFLTDLLRQWDPDANPNAASVAGLLDIGASRARVQLSDQPEARAEVMAAIGEVYMSLGQWREAQEILTEALTLRETTLPPDHSDVVESLRAVALTYVTLQPYETADSLLREAESRLAPSAPGSEIQRAAILGEIALLRFNQGRYHEADSAGRASLSLRRANLEPDHPSIGQSLSRLGMIARRLGPQSAAESYYREALANRIAQAEVSAQTAEAWKNLGLVLQGQARFGEAEEAYRKALVMQEEIYGEVHPAVSTTINSLASLLRTTGSYAESESLHRQALTIRETIYGADHPRVATSLANLSGVLLAQGRPAEGVEVARRALAIRTEALGPRHPNTATAMNELGRGLRDLGRYDEALGYFVGVEAIYADGLGPRHLWVGIALSNIGKVELLADRPVQADSVLRKAMDIMRADGGAAAQHLAPTLVRLGRALLAQERTVEAEAVLREGLALTSEILPDDHFDVAAARASLGECLARLGDEAEAEPLLRRAERVFSQARGAEAQRELEHVREALRALPGR